MGTILLVCISCQINSLYQCGTKQEDLMPGIFHRMFEPSKKIAQMITSLVDEHGLVPGQYFRAHMRAKYSKASCLRIFWKKEKVTCQAHYQTQQYSQFCTF